MTDPRLGIAALLDELQAHGRTHVDDRLRVYESSPGLGTDIDVAEARRVLLSDDPGVSAARRSRYEAIILGQGRPVRPLHTPRDLIRLPPEWVGADNLVDLQVRIDPNGAKAHWGLFFFTHGLDPTAIETLVLSGGHDQAWTGDGVDKPMTLRIPRQLLSQDLILHVEPFCSDHVPQYGDRYGHAKGPFDPNRPVDLRIDKRW